MHSSAAYMASFISALSPIVDIYKEINIELRDLLIPMTSSLTIIWNNFQLLAEIHTLTKAMNHCNITISGADYIIENNHYGELFTPNPIILETTTNEHTNQLLDEMQDYLNHNLSTNTSSDNYIHFTDITPHHQVTFIEYLSEHADTYKQKHISQIIDAMTFGHYKRNLESDDIIRINSLASKRAGAWMQCIPSTRFLELKNVKWTILMKWRLNMDQCNDGKQCNACFNTNHPYTMTSKAFHALLCAKWDQYRTKHDNLKHLLFKFFKKATWRPQKEVKYLFGDGLKPADILIPLYRDEKPLCLDITIPNVLAPSRYIKQFKDPNFTFNHAIQQKNKKYKRKCEENNLIFMPFIMDIYGKFEKKTFDLLKEICEPIAEHTGYSKDQTMDYVFRSVSMTLMKDIAKEIEIRIRE